jgi:N-acetylmuramoyl-L-alanine amidase
MRGQVRQSTFHSHPYLRSFSQQTGSGPRCVPSFLALLFFLAVLLSGQTQRLCQAEPTAAELLKGANQCRLSLYGSGKKMKYRHNWMKCIGEYEKIYLHYPKNDEAAWALYHSADLHGRLYGYSGLSSDLDEALRLSRRLADEYETHRLADDAQYRIGEIYYKLKKDPMQAYVEFLKLDIKFPSGDMRPKAKAMLDQLAIALSQREAQTERIIDEDSAEPASVAVKDIRHWSTPNYTRVVVDLERPVKYIHHLLKPDPELNKPRRLYLDLEQAKVTSEIESQIPIKDGLLQMARAGQYTKDTVRVVLDIENLGGYKVFHLHDPFRIVVDVRSAEDTELKTNSVPQKRTARRGIRRAEDPEGKVSLARQLGLSVKRIVIDPGHGGKDPGCYARGRVREKDIVLNLAKLLAAKIQDELGCEVFLTRNRDVFLPLERRTAIANVKKADLFISLHINAHKDRDIQGLETYFLNMATDERAVMVAARENATSEKNISDLQTILNDLMLNTKIHESSRLAHQVQNGLVSKIKLKYENTKDLGVKQAPFYVLIGADMPAILVETGFLTNPTERKRLLSKGYQEALAEGITAGIAGYIRSIEQVYQGG